VGGVRQLTTTRLLEGRERELGQLVDETLDWVQAYRSPMPAAPISDPGPARADADPQRAAFLACADRRSQALASVMQLTLEEGFANLTDAQIADFAGITTEAFHRQFASKEAAYLALLDEIVREASESARGALADCDQWPRAVRCAMHAYVGYLVGNDPLQRIAFVDVFDVGPAAVGRITRTAQAVTDLLAAEGPPARHGPAIAREAVAGAVWAILASYAAGGVLSRLPRLADHLSFVMLAPYLGTKAAHAELALPLPVLPARHAR
jgi:AcrR family transcriptional regulator